MAEDIILDFSKTSDMAVMVLRFVRGVLSIYNFLYMVIIGKNQCILELGLLRFAFIFKNYSMGLSVFLIPSCPDSQQRNYKVDCINCLCFQWKFYFNVFY